MRRIVVTGPESSGKTTLALALAAHFDGRYVPEMARTYLAGIGRSYVEADLLGIARMQLHEEEARIAGTTSAPILVCDTDLITIRIWGEEKYGRSDPWIIRNTEQRPYDLWLLCAPDMPWEYDPLRENPHDRDRLFEVYERTLIALRKPYVVMRGSPATRMQEAVQQVGALLP
ncbi:MAG TPA: ATP-binding protein [Flavobacteriales bacterium]